MRNPKKWLVVLAVVVVTPFLTFVNAYTAEMSGEKDLSVIPQGNPSDESKDSVVDFNKTLNSTIEAQPIDPPPTAPPSGFGSGATPIIPEGLTFQFYPGITNSGILYNGDTAVGTATKINGTWVITPNEVEEPPVEGETQVDPPPTAPPSGFGSGATPIIPEGLTFQFYPGITNYGILYNGDTAVGTATKIDGTWVITPNEVEEPTDQPTPVPPPPGDLVDPPEVGLWGLFETGLENALERFIEFSDTDDDGIYDLAQVNMGSGLILTLEGFSPDNPQVGDSGIITVDGVTVGSWDIYYYAPGNFNSIRLIES